MRQFKLILLIIVVMPHLICAQEMKLKPVLAENNFEKWHKIRFSQISNDGEWISYQLNYELSQDTLFLMNSEGSIRYKFEHSKQAVFQPSKKPTWFVFKNTHKGIGVVNLEDGKINWEKKIDRFEFSEDGRYLALYKITKEEGYLKILDTKTRETTVVHHLKGFKFSSSGKKAVIITSDSGTSKVALLKFPEMEESVIVSSDSSEYLYPTWSDFGEKLCFLKIDSDLKLTLFYFEDNDQPLLKILDDKSIEDLGSRNISKLLPFFSKDGEQIFFWTHNAQKEMGEIGNDTIKLQIWKGSDKWIYPRQKLDWEYNKNEKLAVWWPQRNKAFQIGTNKQPEVILSGDGTVALTYNLLTYEPQYRARSIGDFYITHLESQSTKLMQKALPTTLGSFDISPTGRYISYFYEKNWWVYNTYKNTHVNVTEKLDVLLYSQNLSMDFKNTPYGFGGWGEDSIFIYDAFDIWRISVDGTKYNRITKGREVETQFRFYKNLFGGNPSYSDLIDVEKEFVLSYRDQDYNEGFIYKNGLNKQDSFETRNGKITRLQKSRFSDSFIYLKENFDSPPALFLRKNGASKALLYTNAHYYENEVDKTALVYYQDSIGNKLRGLLHFPVAFNPKEKYPLIVHIYQKLSQKFHEFTYPSLYNEDGFNYKTFTSSGYFVLEPDIILQQGNPGYSALDCVTEAVKQVIETESIDKQKIGLIGHSFGGYETAFIISQSKLFSAAVVGAGIFDIVHFYHTINDYGQQQNWRFENMQWNIGEPFYLNPQKYYKNNPLHYSERIITPTLIWTGNMDYHVNWNQSVTMYLALRRTNTPVEFLLYENEGHALTASKNQKDLTIRILKWFASYL